MTHFYFRVTYQSMLMRVWEGVEILGRGRRFRMVTQPADRRKISVSLAVLGMIHFSWPGHPVSMKMLQDIMYV